jgi:hypothetical protein
MDPGPISIILLSPIYFTRILSLFFTRYAYNLCFKQTGEIDNLIVSWKQSTWLCVCRFRIATGRRRVNKCTLVGVLLSQSASPSVVCLSSIRSTYLGFLTERKFAAIFITPSSWGSQRAGHLPCNKQQLFWRRCWGGSRRLLRGEFFARTSFTLLLFCFTLFILPASFFIKKPKKIRILGSCYFFTLVYYV